MAAPSFAWSMPPSVGGSMPALCVFLAGLTALTVTLFVRHERSSNGVDWLFAKADAHAMLGGMPPELLLVYRIAVFVFCADQLASQIQGAMFYTIWNFSLLTVYFLVALINSATGCYHYRCDDGAKQPSFGLLGRPPPTPLAGFAQKLQLVLFEIEAPAAFLIDLVVWTVLVPAADAGAVAVCQDLANRCTHAYADQHNQTVAACIATQLHNSTLAECQRNEYNAQNAVMHSWGMYVVHGMNSLFIFIELVFSRLPIRPWHVFFTGWWATAYCVFQDFFWYPLHHQWMYFFMDTGALAVVPWMLGLLAVHWLFFFLSYSVQSCKGCCGGAPAPLNLEPQT